MAILLSLQFRDSNPFPLLSSLIFLLVHGSYVSPGGNVPFCGNDVFLPSVEDVRDAIEDTLLIEVCRP